jgi:septum formation protein
MNPHRLVLASASPRRRELLDRLGLEYTISPPDVDESHRDGETAETYVRRLALAKTDAVTGVDWAMVVAADTAVVVDDEILGKPRDSSDGLDMLARLEGRSHQVVTGVAVRVVPTGAAAAGVESTVVHLDVLGPARSEWYVAGGEGADKAGGYGLQGAAALFADRVEGSVSNVIGLPLPLLDRLCRDVGVELLSFRAER